MILVSGTTAAAACRQPVLVLALLLLQSATATEPATSPDSASQVFEARLALASDRRLAGIRLFEESIARSPADVSLRIELARGCAGALAKLTTPDSSDPLAAQEKKALLDALDAQLRFALTTNDPWPEYTNSPQTPAAIFLYVHSLSAPDILEQITARIARERYRGYEIQMALVRAVQNERLLADIAKKGHSLARQAAVERVSNPDLLTEIIIANLQDPKDSELDSAFQVFRRFAAPDTLKRLELRLRSAPWRGPANLLASLARLKQDFLLSLAPLYPGAQIDFIVSSTRENYGWDVKGANVRIDVIGASGSANNPTLMKNYRTVFPDRILAGTTWVDPHGPITSKALLPEFRSWLEAVHGDRK